MPAVLEPLRPFKCTYKDCFESFDTEKDMQRHKKRSTEHDYCSKCNLDFEDPEEYAFHKITAPKEHDLACRVCGEEFKSISGHKRHIEKNHRLNQRLTCIGCYQSFHNAYLFIEHLEFGHCDVISPSQFQGHIVHKHLITELLKGGDAYMRFQQKTSKYEAAIDCEEEGGVSIGDAAFEDEGIEDVMKFKAIQPDTPPETPLSPKNAGPYPPLPSQMRSANTSQYDTASDVGDLESELASILNGGVSLDGLSISGDSEASTVVNSPIASPVPANRPTNSFRTGSSRQPSITQGSTTAASSRQPKVWGSRVGKTSSNVLFPGAKPTPVTKEFSIEAHDSQMEKDHGLNIMRSRFWDPMSSDFNPERFFDSVMSKYYCPFICEQSFHSSGDLNTHIMTDHRITRMKCPSCLKYFKSASALMGHCEARGAKCEINKADDFNIFLDRLSGGFLGVEEKIRPDHLNNPEILRLNETTGRMEKYQPPVAKYLQYTVTKPPDWKEPVRGKVVGGFPSRQSRDEQW